MIRGFLVLALVVAGWWAALWLSIVPDFSQWRMPELAALHAGPPLVAWGAWLFWRRHRRERLATAAAEREAVAEKERQTKLDEARQQHAAELQRLRFGCDCLALAVAQVAPAARNKEALVPEGESVSCSTVAAEAESVAESSMLDHLQPGIEEALGAIYTRCPAAAVFPVYVAPPAESVGEEVVARLRQLRARFVADLGLPLRSGPEFDRVLFLPARDSAADSVIGLFEANPELPGAVVLAFDSPWWREQILGSDDWDDGDARKAEQRKWTGKPGQGVFALLLTNPQLAEMLAAIPRRSQQHDALTPYWEKDHGAAGRWASLAALSDDERDDLQRLPPIARIHRAAMTRFDAKPPRSMEFARGIEALIERAQIHASLIELPFDPPVGTADVAGSPAQEAAADCHWLVHNAGGIDRAGHRLAALGVALLRRGMELDPIAAATSVTVKAGDLGQARGVAMLAMTVARAASSEGSALCAEFLGDYGLALFFAAVPEGAA